MRRSIPAMAVGLVLLCLALPAVAQQEQEQEQEQEQGEAEPGSGEGEQASNGKTEKEAEAPSVTMVHFGPNRAGGALASRYPDQAREIGQEGATFTGLLKRETTAKRHGGVVVVAASGQSADQGLTGAVRRQLPEAGWLTLSLGQPAEPVADMPERVLEPGESGGGQAEPDGAGDDNGEQAPENGGGDGGNDDTEAGGEEGDSPDMTIQVAEDGGTPERGEDWQSRALGRLEAAVQVLRDEGVGVIVLVGIGDGADLALRYARANAAALAPGQFGMVWVAPRLRAPFSSDLGTELGQGYPIPILDLYDRRLGSDSRAGNRAAAARRAGFETYTQSALPIPLGEAARDHRRIPARIRGWLGNHLKNPGQSRTDQ
ncbi:DUF3530 family protein [Halomonadaceae bacterium KBTZ08]